MSSLYSELADQYDSQACDAREKFEELFRASQSYDAQLIATSVVYAGEAIAAALYRAMKGLDLGLSRTTLACRLSHRVARRQVCLPSSSGGCLRGQPRAD